MLWSKWDLNWKHRTRVIATVRIYLATWPYERQNRRPSKTQYWTQSITAISECKTNRRQVLLGNEWWDSYQYSGDFSWALTCLTLGLSDRDEYREYAVQSRQVNISAYVFRRQWCPSVVMMVVTGSMSFWLTIQNDAHCPIFHQRIWLIVVTPLFVGYFVDWFGQSWSIHWQSANEALI
jgi:hypothetical protein